MNKNISRYNLHTRLSHRTAILQTRVQINTPNLKKKKKRLSNKIVYNVWFNVRMRSWFFENLLYKKIIQDVG